MGTTYSVKIAGVLTEDEQLRLERATAARLDEIDRRMSTWRDDSEVTRFGASASTEWFEVSGETAAVVATAQRIAEDTGGAFDITVAPLVDLWGFGPEGEKSVPSDDDIAAAMETCGWSRLDVGTDSAGQPALRKTVPDLRIDLSAIAKGYAVDAIAEVLEAMGHSSYMVEIGGEVRVAGEKAPGTPWRIGIQLPDAARAVVESIVALEHGALATSGDYRNFFRAGARRYSHTIDPRTGRPVEHSLASVSVIAPTCEEADALATALMVLGPEEGYTLATERGLAVLLVVRKPSPNGAAEPEAPRFEHRMTPSMERHLSRSTHSP